MILKNFINFINIFNFILLLLFIYMINFFLQTNNIRIKFLFFIILTFIISFLGLYYSLDGMVMLFLISELAIIVTFITMYSQLFSYNKTKKNFFIYFFSFILIFFNYKFYSLSNIGYKNFYSFNNTTANDFYYIFNCYFEKHVLMIIFVTFLLTMYSIYFILFYFNLKKFQNIEVKKNKNLNFLRKQNLIKQSNYYTPIRLFQ